MTYLHQASPQITNRALPAFWDFLHLLALGSCAPGAPAQHQLCPHKGLNGRLERAQWQGYVRMSSQPDSPMLTLLRGCGGLREAERSFSTVPLAASCTPEAGWDREHQQWRTHTTPLLKVQGRCWLMPWTGRSLRVLRDPKRETLGTKGSSANGVCASHSAVALSSS